MTQLSWLIYLAEVLPNFSYGIFVISALGLLALVAFNSALADQFPRKLYWVYPLAVLLMLFTTLVPSKTTIYLIAGVEAGDTVVQSETGQEMLEDVHNVIKLQLQKLQGE